MNHSKENELKRMNKTAIALATAGALGFGAAPAMARDADNLGDLDPNSDAAFVSENAPENPAGEPDGPTVNVPGGETWDNNIAPSQPATATSINDLTKTPEAKASNTAPMKNVVCREDGKSVTYLRHADGLNYVKEGNKTTGALPGGEGEYRSLESIRTDGNCSFVDGGNVQGPVAPGEAEGPSDKDIAKAVAAIAGAGVGTAIIINGIKYFVNKDKQTLVPSEDRVNQEPTAEEKAKSDELKANNADQIAQQTGTDATGANTTANGERGMSAATGVNKVPAALMALLLASVLGAAAFVFGRRQLV